MAFEAVAGNDFDRVVHGTAIRTRGEPGQRLSGLRRTVALVTVDLVPQT
ncbi:MAG TPA: hypothetical protein VHG10_15125 [Glycomyces sp.]|nr:hypothetical protein [Glycomyces sp.]